MAVLDLKITVTEEVSLDGSHSKFEMAEERISEFEIDR